MGDRSISISLSSATVAVAWVVGLALAVADIFVTHNLAAVATVFLVLGAVLSVRAHVNQHAANWAAAYEVGKEAGLRRIPPRP